ncbi:TVG0954986 [Thermoplasma volcanium GSS1]|uniref:TVG0954986 protein n=1 Tax=Thermoplasma volcanium (strain ATCC 51530 / DSM 4299 / JCM 9571 / NBRC 15438 / GSS1) TaxID=273116 RepID=Q97A83_THEVO|nr:TVG0954986 [Thermoplasma volcanium GSS1]
MEMQTTGMYVFRVLRGTGFSIHIAEHSKLAFTFNKFKKNDKRVSVNAYKTF